MIGREERKLFNTHPGSTLGVPPGFVLTCYAVVACFTAVIAQMS